MRTMFTEIEQTILSCSGHMFSAQLVVNDSEAMMLGICGLPAESLQDMCRKKSCVAHGKKHVFPCQRICS